MLLKSPSHDEKLPTQATTHSSKKQQYSLPTLIGYWLGPVLIVTCHIGSLLAFSTGLSLGAWAWIVFLYWIRMLAITGIYHRLLTHKSYSSPAPVKWIGSIIASSAGQMGPNWWKAHHEEHHRFTDQPQDPHSSVRGIQWSHYQWLLSRNFLPTKLPADVEQDIVLKTIDRLHFVPTLALGFLSYAIGGAEYLAAFFISTTLLFHGVALVNSACHKFGTTPFKTDDYSKNNGIVAVLTLGEGWHNCHHAFPWSARQGITLDNGAVKYLPDFTFGFIQVLQSVGLASKVKLPAEPDVLVASAE
ncbi:MAG: delta 9 acyl-lipid fatty acid desaturase [Leptolyngbya foveolarum]|uniref:Delta 9 acyl-lipid fatty acid desaturase n=1 Tax=Leptolyngbya foveolarum TaxID=47253 RepID=A0A2W4UBT3_9CYAN|nr:MAG: delta 9 acyl-lipid fatty acid desaturase [Leptolyngbya foveolarum]